MPWAVIPGHKKTQYENYSIKVIHTEIAYDQTANHSDVLIVDVL